MGLKEIQRVLGRWEAALLSKPGRVNSAPRLRDAPGCAMAEVNTLFELSCVCAVTEKSYVLQFQWIAGGKLKFLKTIQGEPAPRSRSGSFERSASRSRTAAVEAFGSAAFPCPWCGDNSINLCRCGALVCGGRTTDGTFHCRPSCGASWVGVPLGSLEGQTKPSVSRAPAAFPNPPKKALPAAGSTQMVKRTAQGASIVRNR